MRILHVTPSIMRSYGGPTYSLIAFARAAIEAHADVTIAAPRPRRDDGDWFSLSLPNADTQLFPSIGEGAFVGSPALHSWLRRNGAAFDVVHVHGLFNPISSLSSRKCVNARWPLVIRPFGTLSRYSHEHRRSLLKLAYFRAIEQRNLRCASAVHFTTAAERDESAWRRIEWGKRAFVVPPPWHAGGQQPSAVKRRECMTVLIIARLNPIKNIELLIDAWPFVQERLPGVELVIAGDGDHAYVQRLRTRAAPYASSLRFVGFVDDTSKAQLLGEADVFVLPSFHENFGIAVLEALAAGLPVVLTAEVQLSAFVQEHELGVVAARSPEALADAIVAVLRNEELRLFCREHGLHLLSQHFSSHAIGRQLLQMYNYAVAHPPS